MTQRALTANELADVLLPGIPMTNALMKRDMEMLVAEEKAQMRM